MPDLERVLEGTERHPSQFDAERAAAKREEMRIALPSVTSSSFALTVEELATGARSQEARPRTLGDAGIGSDYDSGSDDSTSEFGSDLGGTSSDTSAPQRPARRSGALIVGRLHRLSRNASSPHVRHALATSLYRTEDKETRSRLLDVLGANGIFYPDAMILRSASRDVDEMEASRDTALAFARLSEALWVGLSQVAATHNMTCMPLMQSASVRPPSGEQAALRDQVMLCRWLSQNATVLGVDLFVCVLGESSADGVLGAKFYGGIDVSHASATGTPDRERGAPVLVFVVIADGGRYSLVGTRVPIGKWAKLPGGALADVGPRRWYTAYTSQSTDFVPQGETANVACHEQGSYFIWKRTAAFKREAKVYRATIARNDASLVAMAPAPSDFDTQSIVVIYRGGASASTSCVTPPTADRLPNAAARALLGADVAPRAASALGPAAESADASLAAPAPAAGAAATPAPVVHILVPRRKPKTAAA